LGIDPKIRGLIEANLAIEAVLVPVIMIGGGAWIDSKYGWSPWGLAIGAVVGISISVVLLMVVIQKAKKDDGID